VWKDWANQIRDDFWWMVAYVITKPPPETPQLEDNFDYDDEDFNDSLSDADYEEGFEDGIDYADDWNDDCSDDCADFP
jgi:hypothetical protein